MASHHQLIAGVANAAPLVGPVTLRGISVVLPAYNEEALIAQTITRCVDVLSIIAPDYEIVVVDDGSRDRTGAIADDFAAGNPRIRVVHNQPNRGYGGALIAGFDAASKPLLFFMDSDGQFDIQDLALLLVQREQGHRDRSRISPEATGRLDAQAERLGMEFSGIRFLWAACARCRLRF